MKVCGPKLSLCGIIISVWGIIQLVTVIFVKILTIVNYCILCYRLYLNIGYDGIFLLLQERSTCRRFEYGGRKVS